jgi:hypothetical protein
MIGRILRIDTTLLGHGLDRFTAHRTRLPPVILAGSVENAGNRLKRCVENQAVGPNRPLAALAAARSPTRILTCFQSNPQWLPLLGLHQAFKSFSADP